MIKLYKYRLYLIIIIICFLYFSIKNDFVKNLLFTTKFNENNRISQIYGFCGGESIGYLRSIKKKFDLATNPEIINFDHTPQVLWSIYNSNYNDKESKKIILLNYPGNEIAVNLKKEKDNLYEIKDIFFLSLISKRIEYLSIDNPNIHVIQIEIYELKKNNNLSKIKTLKLKKDKNEIKFSLNENLKDLINNDDNKIFLKFVKNDNSKINLILRNKYMINEYKIIDKYQNCYFLEK